MHPIIHRLIFSATMAFFMAFFMTFFIILLNLGWKNFTLSIWLHAFIIAWPLATCIATLFVPFVQIISQKIIRTLTTIIA